MHYGLAELDGEMMIDVSSWQSSPALTAGKGVVSRERPRTPFGTGDIRARQSNI